MPGLLTLHTDLKSLKYGQDRPDGGSSGQPYITTDINTASLRIPFDDGSMRYGIVGALKASETDRLRIKKFLYNDVKGTLFIVKQVGLQLSNPRLEVPKNPRNIIQGIPENVLAFGTNGLLEPTRIYNGGVNTLAQIPVTAFGRHFNRHGLLVEQSEASKYEAVVAANNESTIFNTKGNNRLISLKSKFKLGDAAGNPNDPTQQLINRANRIIAGFTNVFNTISAPLGGPRIPKFSLTPEQLIIDQYFGGPDSVYGLGQTIIRRSSNTENGDRINEALDRSKQFAGKAINDKNEPIEVNYVNSLGKGSNAISNYGDGITINKDDINKGIKNYSTITPPSFKNTSLKTYSDLKNQINQQKSTFNKTGYVPSGSSFDQVNVNQFGIFNTATGLYSSADNGLKIGYQNSYGEVIKVNFTKWSDVSRENRVGSGRWDRINLTPLFSESSYWYNNTVKIKNNFGFNVEYDIRDLVKFAIQSVNTDRPEESDFMIFRAYLTQLSDGVDASWNPVKYAGRGNKFYIYDGFDRKIQIGFKVAALSAEEMQPMYSKLNYLMSTLMPDYGEGNVMRGSLHRLTVGNYLDAQLGILTSVSYTVPNDSPWEIALDEPEGGTKQLILPHIIEVSMNFTPIGAETGVRVGATGSDARNKIEQKSKDTSFIAQNTTGNDKAYIQYYNDFVSVADIAPVSPIGPTSLPINTTSINLNNLPRKTNDVGGVDIVPQPNINLA